MTGDAGSPGHMADLLLEQVQPLSPESPTSFSSSSRLGSALAKLANRPKDWQRPALPVPHFAAPEPLVEFLADALEGDAGDCPGDEEPVEPSGADRRAHPRHDSECDVWVSLRPPHLAGNFDARGESGRTRIRGKVVDVSLGGFALRLHGPVEPGHRMWMSISSRHFSEVLETEGSALRCTPLPSGEWHVVCHLSRRLTFEQVNFVGKQLFASTLV